MTGTVAFWDMARGYGFITPDTRSGDDLFVHSSNVMSNEPWPALVPGQRVSYLEAPGRDGRIMAKNVRLIVSEP